MAWIQKKSRPRISMRDSDTRRRERNKVYGSMQWRRLSVLKKMSDPLCEVCLMLGKTEAGTDVHHLQSFTKTDDAGERYDRAYDYDNLMTLCDRCHTAIHHGWLKGCESREDISKRIHEFKNKIR